MKNLKCDLGEEELRREPYVPGSQLTVAVPTAMPVLSVISCLTGKYQEFSVYLPLGRRSSCMFSEANKEVSAFRGQPRILILTLGIQATK